MMNPCHGTATIAEQSIFVNCIAIQETGPPGYVLAEFEFHPSTVKDLIRRCPRIPSRVSGDSADLVGSIVLETLNYVRKCLATGRITRQEAQDPDRLLRILRKIARRHNARAKADADRRRTVSLDELPVEPSSAEFQVSQLDTDEVTSAVKQILLECGSSAARADAFLLSAVYGYSSEEILSVIDRVYGVVVNKATLLQWRSRDKAKLSRVFRRYQQERKVAA